MAIEYSISASNDLIRQTAQGMLDLDALWHLNSVLWENYDNQDMILMDWSGITVMNASVRAFSAAGRDRERMQPPGRSRSRAAFAASNRIIYGVTDAVVGVWSNFLYAKNCRSLHKAAAWLRVDQSMLGELEEVARGQIPDLPTA